MPDHEQIDPLPGHVQEFWQGSDKLFILFAGYIGNVGLGGLQFVKNAGILDHSRLLLRDPLKAWYQRGIPDISPDIQGVARFLETQIAESGAKEIRFVGNSMGGFAALLFCSLLKQGRAIVFAPQTFLSLEKIAEYGDDRQQEAIAEMHRHRTPSHIYDLRAQISQHSPQLSADIYFDPAHTLDAAHANDLAGLGDIQLHHADGGSHRVLVHLHRQGQLARIFAR